MFMGEVVMAVRIQGFKKVINTLNKLPNVYGIHFYRGPHAVARSIVAFWGNSFLRIYVRRQLFDLDALPRSTP